MKKTPNASEAPAPDSGHRPPKGLSQGVTEVLHPDPRQSVYLPEGPFAEFHKLNPRHHLEQENEALRTDPANECPVDPFALGQD